jgi:hypothetical protein
MVSSYEMAGKNINFVGLPYERNVVSGRDICRETMLGYHHVIGSPSSILYTTNLVRRSSDFYPNSSPHADVSAVFKWLYDYDFGFVHQVLSYARIRSTSQTSRSLKFGLLKLATISDLIHYGHRYLTPQEYDVRFAAALDGYYSWLVKRMYEHKGDKEFWDLQKAGLQSLGLTYSNAKLYKTAVLRMIEEMGSPQTALRKVMRLKKASKEIEAKYYFD